LPRVIEVIQTLHSLHTEVPDINNLGKPLSLKQQLQMNQKDRVLTQFCHSQPTTNTRRKVRPDAAIFDDHVLILEQEFC